MEDEDEAERLINPAISDVESSKRKTRKEKAHSSKGKRDHAIQGSPKKIGSDFQEQTTAR
jgi:hypothetical protein